MRCHECKRKLSKQVEKIAKGLGATKVLCGYCGPRIILSTDKFIKGEKARKGLSPAFFKAIKKVNRRHNKTFRKLKD